MRTKFKLHVVSHIHVVNQIDDHWIEI